MAVENEQDPKFYSKWGFLLCCFADGCHYPDAQWHGTSGGYTNHKCRCGKCTEEWRNYHREGGYSQSYRRMKAEMGYNVDSPLYNPVERTREYKERPKMQGPKW